MRWQSRALEMHVFLGALAGSIGFTIGGLIGGSLACAGASGFPCNSWISVIGTLLGVVCGAGIAEFRNRHEAKMALQGHLEAIALEIRMVHQLANGYIRAGVKSPLYRFPTAAFEKSLPELLTKRLFNAREAWVLQHFLIDLQAINRSLDYAHSFLTLYEEKDAADKPLFNREIIRATRKIKRFADPPLGDAERYKPAFESVSKHLPNDVLPRISFELDE